MKWIALLLVAVVALVSVVAAQAPTSQPADEAAAAIAGDRLPPGYRDWRLISVAREEGDLDDIRAILGNDAAIKAYRARHAAVPRRHHHRPPCLELRLVGREQQDVWPPPIVRGRAPKNGVQFMVKDSKRYASTGGWRYAQFDDGKPLLDAATLQSCFQCHQAFKEHDYVFTRYAP